MKHRFCRRSVCGEAPESLCVEGSLNSAITLVDKKNMGDKITIVVPTKVGKCQLKTISLIEWKEFLK